MKIVAFIPSRSGSERVKDKNIRPLAGVPLLGRAVEKAIDSGAFSEVVAVTDSEKYAKVAADYGASVPCLRPAWTALSDSPDIQWVSWAIEQGLHGDADGFAILRPTSPFLSTTTIASAVETFRTVSDEFDSLRSITKTDVHPAKMWIRAPQGSLSSILPFSTEDGVPWHSSQTKILPSVYYQNASLEISSVETVRSKKSIAGDHIYGFLTPSGEELDINSPLDFEFADFLMGKFEG